MSDVSFRVGEGDRIGLVGRKGAGKTTLSKVLSGTLPASEGSVEVHGELGYLPQDTHAGDTSETVISRILSARGLDDVLRRLPRRGGDGRYEPERGAPGEGDEPLPPPGGRAGLARRLRGRGGGQADVGEPGSAQPAARAGPGLPVRGQRRRVELTRILFSQASTMILD